MGNTPLTPQADGSPSGAAGAPWDPVSPQFRLHADPLLPPGARLSRSEFHSRYERTAPGFHAELIGGVIYPRDPGHGTIRHGRTAFLVSGWAVQYERRTPGTQGCVRPTVLLGPEAEPEPDFIMRKRTPELDAAEGEWVTGGPELVAEIADHTLARDLGPKLRDYQANGVIEYLVVDVRDRAVRWFVRDEDDLYVDLAPDADGLLKGRVFPGLWLDPAALFAENLADLEAAVVKGVAERDANPG